MPKTTVTFGEIMLRLAPPGFERFLQSPQFVATFGGGEANVAVAVATFGLPARYVTLLPPKQSHRRCGGGGTAALRRGHLADRARARAHAGLLRGDGREPAAFEGGLRPRLQLHRAGQAGRYRLGRGVRRRRLVSCDRDHAGHQRAAPRTWRSKRCARRAEKGLTVSCDLNYRKNLWKWGKPAERSDAGVDALRGRGHRQRGRLPDGAGHRGSGGRARRASWTPRITPR